MGQDGGHQLRISGRGRWKRCRRLTTAAFVVEAWAGVVCHRWCWGYYDGGGVTPRENYILSERATELSEGRNFTILGEVKLERADELICSSYIKT